MIKGYIRVSTVQQNEDRQWDELTTKGVPPKNIYTDIGQFSNADKLDRNIITQLIDSITVSERKQVDGRWEQSIDIEYRFIGNLLNESENEVKKENIA